MKTVLNMTPSGCPVCFAKIDAATHMGNRKPKPGSIGICVYCSTLLRYEPGLTVRQLTDEEVKSLEPDIQAHLRATQTRMRQLTPQKVTRRPT